jgi:urease accessory protein
MRRSHLLLGVLTATGVLLALSGPAAAHPGPIGHDLAAGFAHPFLGLDHLLAMVGVGLWAAQLAERTQRPAALWAVPGAFVTMMVAGAVVGMAGTDSGATELGIVGSLVVLGSLVALAPRLPIWAGMALAGAFAVFHGHAHGTELPLDATAELFGAGFIAATALLHAAGIGLAFALRRTSVAQPAIRLGGVAVALAGIAFYVAG